MNTLDEINNKPTVDNETKILTKSLKVFNCNQCQFKCGKLTEWSRHLATSKHIKLNPAPEFTCTICGKEFKSRQSLWYHKTKCVEVPDEKLLKQPITNPTTIKNNIEFYQNDANLQTLVLEIVKSNTELQKQKQFMDMFNSMQAANSTTIHNNSHNKTFNMQVFLNEHCKDAMNLKDFVDSIQLSLADLEMVGEKGFVDGISKIITCNLRATDVHMRPFHCSDVKREVMYVKENDKWEKESPRNERMRSFIQKVEHKNIRLLVEYCEANPDCLDPESPLNDHYLSLSAKATCATDEHIDKVISRIASEVVVDKK